MGGRCAVQTADADCDAPLAAALEAAFGENMCYNRIKMSVATPIRNVHLA
jgi:hypothetical protein